MAKLFTKLKIDPTKLLIYILSGDKLDKADPNCKSYRDYGLCMQESISHVSINIYIDGWIGKIVQN